MADKYTADQRGVANWLRDHLTINGRPTTKIDAIKAVRYSGPPLTTAEGNLSNNRANLRFKPRGDNGDHSRKQNLNVSTPENANTKRANLKVKHINGKGKQGDHYNPIARTGNAIRALLKTGQVDEAMRLVRAFGRQIGHQPENIQALTAKQNGQKEKDYRTLDRKLRIMETKSQSPTLKRMGVKQPRPKRKGSRRGSLRVFGGAENFETYNLGLSSASDVGGMSPKRISDGNMLWLLP